MFEGIDGKRLLAMVPQERRWLDNLKKAFYESDIAVTDGRAADRAFPEICNAIDVAATLSLSLRAPIEDWKAPQTAHNKRKFTEFLCTEIPDEDDGGLSIELVDARTGERKKYDYAGLVYAVRCMLHENENLNAAERPDYHVTLDWQMRPSHVGGTLCDGRVTCNAREMWQRLREVLAKFITGMDALMAFETRSSWSINSSPPLKSIHPEDGCHTRRL